MLPEEQAENSRYFYELASARFGWSWDVLTKVQAFHFKLGQGAKTGTGGHLPGPKVEGPHRRGARPARGHARGLAADVPRLARRRRLPPLRRRGARPQRRHPDRREAVGAARRGRHRRRARDRRRLRHPRRPRRRHRRGAAAVPRQHLGADDPRARPGPPPPRPAQAGATSRWSSPAGCATRPTSPRRSRSAPTRSRSRTARSRRSAASACARATPNNCPVGIATQKQHLRARLPVDEAAHRLEPLPARDGRAHAGARARVRARPPVALLRSTTSPRSTATWPRSPASSTEECGDRRREQLVWHKVAEVDELADGRVMTVTAGRTCARAHALRRRVRRARQPLPAPGRSARRRLDREGLAALPVARLRLRPDHGHAAARLHRRARVLSRSRCAPTACTSRCRPSSRARAPSPT